MSGRFQVQVLPGPIVCANKQTRTDASVREWATLTSGDEREITRKVRKVPKEIANSSDGCVFVPMEDFRFLNIQPGDFVWMGPSEMEVEMP